MITIYKYPLPVSPGRVVLSISGFRRLVDAGQQDGQLVVWAEVDTEVPIVISKSICIEWTGQPLDKGIEMGLYTPWRSIQTPNGIVHHLYV